MIFEIFTHMPFYNLFPTLPWSWLEVTLNVAAALGAILLSYGIFLESERKQDAVFIVGSSLLLVYSLWIGNKIFSIAMAGVALCSLVELMEIMMGRHIHSFELVEKYKNPKK